MSVTEVREINGRKGNRGQQGKRGYTRRYRVIASSKNDASVTVRSASAGGVAIPALGMTYDTGYEADARSFVKSIATDEGENNGIDKWEWIVTVEYAERDKLATHPLNRPSITSGGGIQQEKVLEKDVDGKPAVNGAGMYFDPPVMADDSRPGFTITRNEANCPMALSLEYQDAVNQDQFKGFAAGKIKIFQIAYTEKYEDWNDEEVHYWEVSYEFQGRKEGWLKEVLNQGRHRLRTQAEREAALALDPNDKSPITAILVDGEPVTDPVKLKGGEVREEGDEQDLYIKLKAYFELPFGPLNL